MNTQNKSTQSLTTTTEPPAFWSRVIQHDAAKKGVAAALSGFLVAAIMTALEPPST